jgi:cytochrome c oxidase cbb3-type subunit III
MPNMTPDEERLLDHDYDGIREFDNPLPRWWVWIFWATIAFAALYVVDIGGYMRGRGRIADYKLALADAERRWPQANAAPDAASLSVLLNDQKTLMLGKTVFATNCAVCHRADAGGNIGPNLTDEYWLHGGDISAIAETITKGVLDKGMPNWGKMLPPAQVSAVTVYVASLRGTNPASPKAPQGAKVGGDEK